MKRKQMLGSDRGNGLIIALVLLLTLTLIGINAIHTTTFETIITGHDKAKITSFHASEALREQAYSQMGLIDQTGFSQIPDIQPLSNIHVGMDSYGSATITPLGLAHRQGWGSEWAFKRYQINSVGESLGAATETEVQVSYGPIRVSTEYN